MPSGPSSIRGAFISGIILRKKTMLFFSSVFEIMDFFIFIFYLLEPSDFVSLRGF